MRIHRLATCVAVFAALLLTAPAVGQACSRDDSVFYETFIDLTCLQQPLTNTTFDALGGLRLITNGAPATATWDSQTDFDSGVAHESITYPPVGARTLTRTGSGQAAVLGLPATLLPLVPGAGPVLGPTPSAAVLAIFTIMLSDFFDTMGTVTGVAAEAGLAEEDGSVPGVGRVRLVRRRSPGSRPGRRFVRCRRRSVEVRGLGPPGERPPGRRAPPRPRRLVGVGGRHGLA